MVLNTKRTKNQNLRNNLKKLKIYPKLSREKMKLLNVLLQIVQNISIQSALRNTMSKSFLSISILIRFTLDVRFIIVTLVALAGIQCPSFNVFVVQKHCTQDAWTKKK